MGQKDRWLHLATVHHGLREFICFSDKQTNQIYIEELIYGTGPHMIKDEALAYELEQFLTQEGILSVSKPMMSDNEWLRKKI